MPILPSLLPAVLRPRVIAVDCGARHVACGLFIRAASGRLVLRQWGFEPHRPDPNPETDWVQKTGEALAIIARRENLGGTCRLALAGHQTLVKFVRSPAVARSSRAGVVEFEAKQGIPLPLEQVVWDHQPEAGEGPDFRFMLAAVKKELSGAVVGAAGAAGLRVAQIVPAGLALLRAFRYSHPGECEGVLAVEIGARSTQLVFIERERFFIRTFLLGGDAVTEAVAEELHVDFRTAEELKIEVLSSRPRSRVEVSQYDAVRRAGARFADRLHLEIVRSTIRYRCHSGADQPVTVYLGGGGSLIPELPLLLADKLALRVVRFEPLRRVAVTPEAASGIEAVTPMLAGLIGLGTSLVDHGWPGLNLLPTEARKAVAIRRRQPALLGAALLAAGAPLPVIWSEQRSSRAADQASAAIEKQLVPLRAFAARNTGNLARLEEVRRRIDVVRGFAAAKSNWAAFFNDLQDRLAQTEDVWLEKLQVVHPPEGNARLPAAASTAAWRFTLGGRLLDKANPAAKAGADAYGRVRSLVQALARSPFVSAIENERFDGAQPGMLRFDFTLVLNSRKPL
jgi:type IV pilus assembly protein PilM